MGVDSIYGIGAERFMPGWEAVMVYSGREEDRRNVKLAISPVDGRNDGVLRTAKVDQHPGVKVALLRG